MLTLALLTIAFVVCLWLQCQFFRTKSPLLMEGLWPLGNMGFIPISAEYSTAIPQQQRWGLRPVANCADGGLRRRQRTSYPVFSRDPKPKGRLFF